MTQTVIVTGASRGIGKAIAIQLIEEGYHVLGIARKASSFEHPNFTPIDLDLSAIEALPAALKLLTKKYPDIRGIICNAGQGQFGHLEEFSYEQIQALMNLNFLSQTYLVKAFLPQMKKRNSGDIIFIGSEAALAGKRKGSIYCASKFALRGFAQALRDECSTSDIRICMINPGMVLTEFFKDLSFTPGTEPSQHILPEDIAKTVSFVLTARIGTVLDEINLSPHKKHIVYK